jgi:1-acyl-sn-glycerol-3-phosphate acyltransferase
MVFAVLRLFFLILWGLLLAPLQWISVKFNLPAQQRIPILFHRVGLKIIGVKVTQLGKPASARPLIVCSNHVSWLDIPALGSLFPLIFVSKADVGRWPVFGTLARLQRSIFIDRNRRSATHNATKEIAARLDEGEAIVVFPEGTTSDGNRVLKFRSSLLGAAQHAFDAAHHGAGIYLQPVFINYRSLHGLPMGRVYRPYAAWYGDMDLVPHLLAIARLGCIEVEISFGEALAFTSMSDRKEMATAAETAVRELRLSSFSNAAGSARTSL